MNIREQIEKDYISAVKAKNAELVDTMRMLRAAIKNADIEKMAQQTEEEIVGVIGKEMKKLKDSVEQFVEGKREDLADKVKREIAVLEAYLPKQMSDEELLTIVKEEVEKLGVQTMKEFGKIMGAVMKRVQGLADGSRVKAAIEKILT
jgi:uncharacterized protein YqeY